MLFTVPCWCVFSCILRVRLCPLALTVEAHDRVVPWQLSHSHLQCACPSPGQAQGGAAPCGGAAAHRPEKGACHVCIPLHPLVETCSGPSACCGQLWWGGGGCAGSSQLPSTVFCSPALSFGAARCATLLTCSIFLPTTASQWVCGTRLWTSPCPRVQLLMGERKGIQGKGTKWETGRGILKMAFSLDFTYSLQSFKQYTILLTDPNVLKSSE